MTARSDAFDACLWERVVPVLDDLGFAFDSSRTFRRLNPDRTRVEIINFQLGQRRFEGRFTVNLGATSSERSAETELAKVFPYDCPYQSRLGTVLPPVSERLKNLPYLGMIFGAHDKWWRFSEDREYTSHQLGEVLELVLNHGIPWLEKCSL